MSVALNTKSTTAEAEARREYLRNLPYETLEMYRNGTIDIERSADGGYTIVPVEDPEGNPW